MPGFWRKCRIGFRWTRITVWLFVLVFLGLFLWCNRIGLPDFLKTPLVATLREHGVDLEFSRMRLNLIRGIVAEDVRMGEAGTNSNASITARLVQLEVDWSALLRRRRLELDGLLVRDGLFALPLSPTNSLSLTNLQTELRFGVNQTWLLDQFRADFAGAQININGEIAHAPEARNWKMFAGSSTDRSAFIASLNIFNDVLRQIHFQGEPQLKLALAGDARDVHSIVIRLDAAAEGVQTPWFSARGFAARAGLSSPVDAPTNIAAAWGFWTNLQPFRLAWTLRLDEMRSRQLNGDDIRCGGVWSAPDLTVTNFSIRLGRGRLTAGVALNVPSRTVTFTNDSDFDPHVLGPLLPENIRTQLSQVSWSRPPVLHADGSFRLPSWTNAVKNWQGEIASSIKVNGELTLTNVAAAGVTLDQLRTHFRYDDLLWELPDLTVVQGRTQLRLSGQESEASKNFRFLLTGRLAADSLNPFLKTTNAIHGFHLLTFKEPLSLTLDVTGNLRNLAALSVTGRLALADFTIRGQTLDHLTTDVAYSNLTAEFLQPHLDRAGGKQKFSADKVILDIAGERLFIQGGFGSMDPAVVGQAIGPKTAADMAPYEFLETPTARVNGCIPIKQKDGEVVQDDADLRVDIVGEAHFRWRKFETPAINGTVHWWNHNLILTNVVTECYGGEARGWATFDLRPEIVGTDFSFDVAGTNVDLHRMGLALWSPTNKLEGTLAGTVTVTRANSHDWHSWNGYGEMQMRDGLLWDVPIFAILSPILNAVTPGLGNSRAKDAEAKFVITNGVITTDSLLINSTMMMRLQYSGTVDLMQNVDARVTAQLLRNTPVVGSVMSAVLWPVSKIFECHVTGRLEDPVVKPIYIPKLLLVPLHPIRSLEELFAPSPGTNAPVLPDAKP